MNLNWHFVDENIESKAWTIRSAKHSDRDIILILPLYLIKTTVFSKSNKQCI